jgi:hypothetical protein
MEMKEKPRENESPTKLPRIRWHKMSFDLWWKWEEERENVGLAAGRSESERRERRKVEEK